MSEQPPCVFCQIVARQAPAAIVDEDPWTLSFVDQRQANRGHVLVVTKAHFTDVRELDPDTAGALMRTIVRITQAVGATFPNQGMSLWNSIGPAAFQEVPHVHFHIHPRLHDDQILQVYPGPPVNADLQEREGIAAEVRRHLRQGREDARNSTGRTRQLVSE